LYSQLLSYKLYPAHQEFPSNFSMFFYVNSIGWHFWMDTNYIANRPAPFIFSDECYLVLHSWVFAFTQPCPISKQDFSTLA
ncbi:hypothetical protein, partial [Thiolapillus sp.]|uniref:hypothetical protein n=1 Tax=Thiolapillus sp. TaxID=2017437 RepID=UPI003AF64A10